MGEEIAGELVLLIFFSLLLVVFTFELKKRIRVPAVIILIIFGVLYRAVGIYIGELKTSVEIVDNIDAEVIMLLILPALIFEASTDIEWYTFKVEIRQIIPLATTVVTITAFLIGIGIKLCLETDYTWSEAFLLGTILSATDHVAVSAQLKETLAHKRLQTLITGETMLNDATVIVLFYTMLNGHDSGQYFQEFFQLSLVGLCVGLVGAILLGYCLGKIINDYIQEVTLTVAGAYLIYYVADATPLKASGAIAVVTTGLYMSAYGKTFISSSTEEILEQFWKIVGRNLEAVLFLLAGMLLELSFEDNVTDRLIQVGYACAMLVFVYLARGIAVMIHYPLLVRRGYGLTFKEAFVVIISGTKGAVSLALALIVLHSEQLAETVRHDILFYTTTVSVLTILIGSFTVKYAVRHFKLESLGEIQERMLVGVTETIVKQAQDRIEHMQREKKYSLVDWERVKAIAGPKQLLSLVLSKTKSGKSIVKKRKEMNADEMLREFKEKTHSEAPMIQETRRRFLGTLRGIYWREFSEGQCMGYSSVILVHSAHYSMDHDNKPINSWPYVKRKTFHSKLLKVLFGLSKIPCIGRFFVKFIYHRLSVAYDVCTTFIKAHEEALELLEDMGVDREVREMVAEEGQAEINLCREYIVKNVSDKYPEVIEIVESNMASHSLLRYQTRLIEELYESGMIEEVEFEYMKDALDTCLKNLNFEERPRIPSLIKLLQKRFPHLEGEQLEGMASQVVETHFEIDSFLFKQDSGQPEAFLILNGGVHEWSDWIDQELRVGNIVGVQHLLPNCSSNITNAQAMGIVRAAKLPKQLITDKNLMEDLYIEAAEEILLFNRESFGIDCPRRYIYKLVKDSSVQRLTKAAMYVNKDGCFVFHGQVGNVHSYGFLPPDDEEYVVDVESIVLTLPVEVGNFYRRHRNLSFAITQYFTKDTKPTPGIAAETALTSFLKKHIEKTLSS